MPPIGRIGRTALAAGAFLALALAGCSQDPAAGPLSCGDCSLHVYVSNQSFKQPVADLLVQVDGLTVFEGSARVESQHNWTLHDVALPAGDHHLTAREKTTGVEGSHAVRTSAGKETWVVVDYWNDEGNGHRFTFYESDTQPMFM